MANMIYTSKRGKTIEFDDFCDNTEEYQSYWVEMCPRCHNKYRGILGKRCDDGMTAQGICSVKGCERDADYYVDFSMEEVGFSMTVKEYMSKNFPNIPVKEYHTPQHKAYAYLSSRLDDLTVDCEVDEACEDNDVTDFLLTVMKPQVIKNLERLCTEFYDVLNSTDVDEILYGFSYEELLDILHLKNK